MNIGIADIRILDILDVLIVVYLMYLMYRLLKGTVAINIFVGVLVFYLVYWLVELFDLKLLKILLGYFVSIGAVILAIIFQPELRRFLLMLGDSTTFWNGKIRIFDKFFKDNHPNYANTIISKSIAEAVTHLSSTKTGALLVLTKNEIPTIINSGTQLDAKVSSALLENIFFKNAPLHDGAVVIRDNKVIAASCILPVSDNNNIPKELGLRHRAAIGATENTNLMTIVVSEETGHLAVAENGMLQERLSAEQVQDSINKYLST